MYNDLYPTCEETYATLRIYPDALDPDEVTERLGVTPTKVQRVGDKRGSYTCDLNGWFLCSNGQVHSRDSRRHIDWILDQVESCAEELENIRKSGGRADISCSWLSASGHGGPTVSPHQSNRLAALGLDCWFDVYFHELLDSLIE